jgi:protein gp37
MSDKSKIEWTEATWNPIRGCTKISPGCKHCYAATFAERFRGVDGHPFEQGFDLRLIPDKLSDPLDWKKPRRIFVNSMSDLFHEDVTDKYISRVAEVIVEANWHTFQVLTKRSSRMRDLLNTKLSFAAKAPNIWWGVSAEDRQYGLPRIAHLREAEVHTRFVSVEPLLEDIGAVDLSGVNWVIVGGESGHGARPFELDWARNLIGECRRQRVACFVKQVGRRPWDKGKAIKLESNKGGEMAEWPEDIRVREFPFSSTRSESDSI